MALSTGARLGALEVVALLGEGGMGEVYRARDTRLNRDVAIKVLPELHAADPERVARFHREAQAVAALNHTNIAAIYDVAEADGVKYLVLELIEGETLAERIRRGPIPVAEALKIAGQMLDALEVAHEKGICHRDLKPGNVKLTPDGSVKVLDFGLAKFMQPASTGGNLTHSPTVSLATIPGIILGTAAYMSPEAAKGFETDQRSDIFSFGCILYELLTGRQAFDGDSASEILASVLKSDVDLSALPPRLNPRLVEVLRRCLEKNPKKRWHAAADVRVELEAIAGRAIVEEQPKTAQASPRWKRALAASAFMLLGAAVAAVAAWALRPKVPAPIMRFVVSLPEGQAFSNLGRRVLSLSPDGSQLVYVADLKLHVRPLASLESRVLPGSEGYGAIVNPVFGPDSQSVVFFAASDRTLKRLALAGGTAITLCPVESAIFGIHWDEHGVVFGQAGKGIYRVSPDGGVPERIAEFSADEIGDSPQMLPSGRAVLYSIRKTSATWDRGQIVVQPFDGPRKTVLDGGADARYLPTGHLVYAVGGVIFAVPFDLQRLTVTGAAVPIVEGVRRGALSGVGSTTTATAHYSVSRTGVLAYVPGPLISVSVNVDIALFDQKGDVKPLKLPPGAYSAPRASPDGSRIAFETATPDGKSQFVAVYDLSGQSASRRLTFEGNSRAPVWSPDSAWIAFQSDREGDAAVYRQRADGSGPAERLTKPSAKSAHTPQSWSPDGAHLLFSDEPGGDTVRSTLLVLDMKARSASPFGDGPAREAMFSPDGRWVAYQTPSVTPGALASTSVFLEPFPRTGARYLVPQPGGHPLWSPRGDELILTTGPQRSHLVSVATKPAVTFGRPVDFPRRGRVDAPPSVGRRQADMLPDGRLLGVVSPDGYTTPQILVVLNWFEDVRQRAGR